MPQGPDWPGRDEGRGRRECCGGMKAPMPLPEPTGSGLSANCFALAQEKQEKILYSPDARGTVLNSLPERTVKGKNFSCAPEAGCLPWRRGRLRGGSS